MPINESGSLNFASFRIPSAVQPSLTIYVSLFAVSLIESLVSVFMGLLCPKWMIKLLQVCPSEKCNEGATWEKRWAFTHQNLVLGMSILEERGLDTWNNSVIKVVV